MTLDEWLTLSRTGNLAFAGMMNACRSMLPQAQADATPLATEDRVSRLRLGRRKVTPGEMVLIRDLTDGNVTPHDWCMGEAPPQRAGGHRRRQYGVWIVHRFGEPIMRTAHISRNGACAAAGFKPPVDAVLMKNKGYECRLVSRFEPTRELRRVLSDA